MRAITTLLGLFLATVAGAADLRSGYFETSFDVIPPYSRADVIAQRAFSAEAWQEIQPNIKDYQVFTVDPREEEWQVYVPEACVAKTACGLLVWVHADDAPRMNSNWREILDEERVIFVAALRSGNNEDTFQRRMPLALAGLSAIVNGYSVDPDRIYTGGFSGGSKVAQLLAFAFPDVFRGAILNAGFLDTASELISLPPAPLDAQLKQVPFALVVGREDKAVWPDYLKLRDGFTEHGIGNVLELTDPHRGHRPLDDVQLQKALKFFAGQ